MSNGVTLVWLRWVAAATIGVFLLLFLASALSRPALLDLHLPGQIVGILVLSFFGLRQIQVFERQARPLPDAVATAAIIRQGHLRPEPATARDDGEAARSDPKQRYCRSGLTEARAEVISQRLSDYMRLENPYLDADLTIETLAGRMAIPRRHLTQVIRERYDNNFYGFVNAYRIRAVKQAFEAPGSADRTLLEIAHACGFNSKSTFNTTVKRMTGTTPSHYRGGLS